MSYGIAKRFSRNGPRFHPTRMHHCTNRDTPRHQALLPMLSLGIPLPTGSVMMAD